VSKTDRIRFFVVFVIGILLVVIGVSNYESKLTGVFPVCVSVQIVGVNADKNNVILVITLDYKNVDWCGGLNPIITDGSLSARVVNIVIDGKPLGS
jgi:hypothetical protein